MLNFQQAISLMQEKICNKCTEDCNRCPWSIKAALKEMQVREFMNEGYSETYRELGKVIDKAVNE